LFVLGLLALVGAALFAWIWQLTHGLGVAGYNDQAFWATYEADLVFFIGLSYGGAVVSAILRLTGASWRAPLTRLAEATAGAALLVGMAFALVHLGHPERIWELVATPNLTSPIFWDFIAITTYLLATLIFFYLPLIPDLALARKDLAVAAGTWRYRLYGRLSRGWEGTPAQRRILHRALGIVAVMIIPLAVSVHSVLSWAFALTSRPGWDSSIFAPYFVIAALYSGVGLVILVVAGFRRGYHLEAFITEQHFVRLGYIMAALGGAYLYLTFADMLPAGYVGAGGSAALLGQMLTGQYAIPFWIFVFGGCIVPLLLITIPATRRLWGVVGAAGLVVAALWLKRLLIVIPGSTQPLVAGGWGTYHFTWVPLLITLGAVAAIPLQLMLIFRVIPVMSPVEMEELAHEDAPATETARVRQLTPQGAK
jgi:molybdopterin-containing oxidoreductase family membrane subunit